MPKYSVRFTGAFVVPNLDMQLGVLRDDAEAIDKVSRDLVHLHPTYYQGFIWEVHEGPDSNSFNTHTFVCTVSATITASAGPIRPPNVG